MYTNILVTTSVQRYVHVYMYMYETKTLLDGRGPNLMACQIFAMAASLQCDYLIGKGSHQGSYSKRSGSFKVIFNEDCSMSFCPPFMQGVCERKQRFKFRISQD